MKKNNLYTEDWLLSKGYSKNSDGSFSPPKSNIVAEIKEIKTIIQKEKINQTPDFTVKPVTEWFIKGYSVPSKKNSRQNFITKEGKQLSIPSKKHAEYVKMTAMQYEVFGKEFRRTVEVLGLVYPLCVEFTFIRSTKHSFDYCNACQTCEDIMKDDFKKGVLVKKGWFPDDSAEYLIPSFKPFRIDKDMPGVIIKLLTS